MADAKLGDKVWVHPNFMTEDHALFGDAEIVNTSDSHPDMVRVRFTITTWVPRDAVEVKS